ncbi:16S rRNA (uracil(1498)-N(3))-methyltransferase [Ferruginibacter sp.]|nr:16S rRNA (uracil(1498)-N(3))-methyltransferase [Ferruginibacter sp.]
MALPFFYKADIDVAATTVVLDEDTSKHIVQVLRMQNGEQLQLTDGKGNLFTCEITDDNRKKCAVAIKQTTNYKPPTTNITIAISLLKNANRFEWFLEKATEIGVTQIIPLVCERTEKTAFKFERMKSILVSAMLQSQQCWLPEMGEPVRYKNFIAAGSAAQKFIAHCEDENNKVSLTSKLLNLPVRQAGPSTSKLILIGPEGDFTAAEIELALQNNFIPVSLGDTRLRTETAGVVAASLLSLL